MAGPPRLTAIWLSESQKRLAAAAAYFGAQRALDTITVKDVQGWVTHLQAAANGRGATLSGGTQRHYLNALSNVFRRAQAEGAVPPGYNPVAGLMEKPQAARREARWLEVPEAAVFLEAARTVHRSKPTLAVPFAYPLIATLLLTGGRPAEVLGLQVADVSFDRRTVTFRPTASRRLKTAQSFRTVPLWPQLEAILRDYIFGADAPPGRLLFPSPASARSGQEQQLTDIRKLLDAVAARAGWAAGTIRAYIFRHTYCAARLQTLDHGAPVSPFTVGREMGHGGTALVHRVYGHLGQHPHRSEVVEYRVEQHLAVRLRDQRTVEDFLRSLAFDTMVDTNAVQGG